MATLLQRLLVFQAIIISIVFGAPKTITIDNTKAMLDVDGNVMNVHEGHIVRWKTNGLFYFYGMQYELCNDRQIITSRFIHHQTYHRVHGNMKEEYLIQQRKEDHMEYILECLYFIMK
eukprot:89469_1